MVKKLIREDAVLDYLNQPVAETFYYAKENISSPRTLFTINYLLVKRATSLKMMEFHDTQNA